VSLLVREPVSSNRAARPPLEAGQWPREEAIDLIPYLRDTGPFTRDTPAPFT